VPEPAQAAHAAGIKALSRRELSRLELTERLEQRGFAPEAAEAAVAELARAGYQSDERTANERARTLAARAYGNLAIRADLRRRGLADRDVAAALERVDSEPMRAAALVRRTGGGTKLAHALHRKGFTEETIERITADSLRTAGDPG